MKFYKFILALLAISFLSLNYSFAQTDEEQIMSDDELLSGFDYEPTEEEDATRSYNILGLGWRFGATYHENKVLSDYMQSQFQMDEIAMPIIMNGFSAKVALTPTRKFSFGVQYLTGSKKYEKATLNAPLQDYSRILKYYTSQLNLSVEYAIVPFKNFAILPGVGFGLTKLELNYSQIKSDYNYDEAFIAKDYDPNTKLYKLDGNFFSVDPRLTLQYKLGNNFMLDLSGSYAIPFSPSWEFNNYSKLNGVPSELKPQGWNFSLGLYLGIFDF